MQCGLHRNIFKISTRTNNNKKKKSKSLQSVNQSMQSRIFVYVEQDKDLKFFSASSLLPFCANITREQYVAKRECG